MLFARISPIELTSLLPLQLHAIGLCFVLKTKRFSFIPFQIALATVSLYFVFTIVLKHSFIELFLSRTLSFPRTFSFPISHLTSHTRSSFFIIFYHGQRAWTGPLIRNRQANPLLSLESEPGRK